MKVSLNWLREFVDIDMPAEELAERLEMTGTALESITGIKSGMTGVKIGRIEEVKPHPQADRLRLCLVDAGGPAALEIVCGAPNIAVGQKVPVAFVGGELPGGRKIGGTVIRGVSSQGMLASEVELGLGEDASGIMILDAGAPVGADLREYLRMDDCVIDFEITPNRPDCMSMAGIAREVAVLTGGHVRVPPADVIEDHRQADNQAKVEVKDSDLCPRYSARVIVDLTVGPSPLWMRQRLLKGGIRPINNIVDITNYVLLETGQPLHAFDLERLSEGTIIVRRAQDGEVMETLDGVERTLDSDMLIIADPGGPIALAGVMGGAATEIAEGTTRCLLESAYFAPTTICRTSQRFDLRSEASSRFERGIDPNGTVYAADRAARLMRELAGGRVLKDVIDVYPKPIAPRRLTLRPEKVNAVLGTELTAPAVAEMLHKIELKVTKAKPFKVTVPTFRPDLEREIDLVEEVARLYGYGRIASTLPRSGGRHGGLTAPQRATFTLRDILSAAGLREIVTYAFVDPKDVARLGMVGAETRLVRVVNPLSEEQSVLRPTLTAGLLKTCFYNKNYGCEDLRLFELGRIFKERHDAPLPEETVMISAAMTGAVEADAWYGEPRLTDFFDAKGVIEAIMHGLRIAEWSLERAELPWLHPGKSANVVADQEIVGFVGELHPRVKEAFELDRPVFVFELSADALTGLTPETPSIVTPSRYPAVIRDIALVVDEDVSAGEIAGILRDGGGELLQETRLFDVYTGEQVPEGKKSLAYRLVFRTADRTLTDAEVDEVRRGIAARLEKAGARIRR